MHYKKELKILNSIKNTYESMGIMVSDIDSKNRNELTLRANNCFVDLKISFIDNHDFYTFEANLVGPKTAVNLKFSVDDYSIEKKHLLSLIGMEEKDIKQTDQLIILRRNIKQRSFFNTLTKTNIYLKDIFDLVKNGHKIMVVDHKTEESVTGEILLRLMSFLKSTKISNEELSELIRDGEYNDTKGLSQ